MPSDSNDDVVARNQEAPPPPPAMTPPQRSWDELPQELVLCIGGRFLKMMSYVAARSVCTAWRSALPPLAASPCLLLVGKLCASVYYLPMRREFGLAKRHRGYRYLGAGHVWLAVSYRSGRRCEAKEYTISRNEAKEYSYRNFEGVEIRMLPDEIPEVQNPERSKRCISLLNPITGKHIVLPEHAKLDPHDVTKVAFAPDPRVDDFTVVVAYGFSDLAYISSRDGRVWSFGAIAQQSGAILDVVYREGGGGGGDKVYCLTGRGDVHVLHVPRGRPTKLFTEPLLTERAGCPFEPAYVFPQPHVWFSNVAGTTKNLVFCNGNLYQVWRNGVGNFRVKLPGDGFFAVPKGEVIVLRYDAARQPCWVPETHLGGHAVFVGPANSTMAVHAEGVPGLKGDCVYWVGKRGDGPAMVFDLRTRQSTPFLLDPSFAARGEPVCWLSLGDKIEEHLD